MCEAQEGNTTFSEFLVYKGQEKDIMLTMDDKDKVLIEVNPKRVKKHDRLEYLASKEESPAYRLISKLLNEDSSAIENVIGKK